MTDEYDSPWKDILELYFPQFLEFFFPHIHHDVDWSRGYQSLDKELPKIVREVATGRRYADKLVKVWRRDGEELLVFIRVEIQGEAEASYTERMYHYNHRIGDRYGRPAVSLAVLANERPDWRPDRYRHELWGCWVELRFPIVKLWDYNERWSELEASDSPFATVVMAHLKTKATRNDLEARLRWKIRIVRRLYRLGYERRQVLELFRFIDWLMLLPPELAERFDDEHERFEAETKMRYVTHVERKAIARGREEGLQLGLQQGREEGFFQGELTLLRRLLQRRYRRLPEWAEKRLEEAGREELEMSAERVIDAESLEEVFAAG